MRYVLVDLEGASRDYFSSRDAAREALLEIEEEAPGASTELYVVAYDDDGRAGRPERGDELLSTPVLDWAAPRVASRIVSGASSITTGSPSVQTRQHAGAHR
jgi:hypothetical protein